MLIQNRQSSSVKTILPPIFCMQWLLSSFLMNVAEYTYSWIRYDHKQVWLLLCSQYLQKQTNYNIMKCWFLALTPLTSLHLVDCLELQRIGGSLPPCKQNIMSNVFCSFRCQVGFLKIAQMFYWISLTYKGPFKCYVTLFSGRLLVLRTGWVGVEFPEKSVKCYVTLEWPLRNN